MIHSSKPVPGVAQEGDLLCVDIVTGRCRLISRPLHKLVEAEERVLSSDRITIHAVMDVPPLFFLPLAGHGTRLYLPSGKVIDSRDGDMSSALEGW